MKNIRKLISLSIIFVLITMLFSSCKPDTAGKDIWYPIDGKITTLDPQCASTSDELAVIQNAMEGLVRKNLKGEIIPGVASRWETSPDGLTYTFYLNKEAKWDLNETQKKLYRQKDNAAGDTTTEGEAFNDAITANDFVFALRRASLPNTNAPSFNSIAAIQGATAVHSGQAEVSALGVTALDAYTLQIRLTAPDTQFLDTLTTAVAMPCSEAYFTFTKGRYGLEKNNTLVNGPFYLASWTGSSVVLKKSDLYAAGGQPAPLPASVTFHITQNKDNVLANLLSRTYDVAILSGKDTTTLTEKDGVTLTPYESTVWSYLFNCEDEAMRNENLRKALCYAFQPPEDFNQTYLNSPEGIVPKSCSINGQAYRTLTGPAAVAANNPEAAVSAWMAGLKELSPSELEISVLCTEEMAGYVKQSVQGLQKTLGNKVNYINKNNTDAGLALSFKIETVTQADFDSRLKTGTYQIAFYPLQAMDDSALNLLRQFQSSGGYSNYTSAAYDNFISQAENIRDMQTEASLLRQCEEELLSHAVVYPVLSESSFFAMAKGVTDVGFSTSGGKVNFVYTQRKD